MGFGWQELIIILVIVASSLGLKNSPTLAQISEEQSKTLKKAVSEQKTDNSEDSEKSNS